jgi:hypothetical protein
MTAIDTRVAHKKTASEFYVVVIRGRFLAISAAAARMGFLEIHCERPFRGRGAACCAPACHGVSHVGRCGAFRELPCVVIQNAPERRARSLNPHIPHNAKSVIRILKFWRYARPRRASRHLNLMPPRSPARTFPCSLRSSLRIPLRRRAVIFRRKPVRAPLVHVRPYVAKPVCVSFRASHWLRSVLPAP